MKLRVVTVNFQPNNVEWNGLLKVDRPVDHFPYRAFLKKKYCHSMQLVIVSYVYAIYTVSLVVKSYVSLS